MREPFYFGAARPLFGVYHAPDAGVRFGSPPALFRRWEGPPNAEGSPKRDESRLKTQLYVGDPEPFPHAIRRVWGPVAREAGVVLCYPMGQEYIRAHRAFLQLAGLLSARGLHVLRFDFSGCGDSGGEGEQASLDHWVEDVSTAVDELKRGAGERIGLIGLRLGATVAMLAGAARGDIAALVLWEPVSDGGRYLAELDDLHRTWLCGSFARSGPDPAHPPTRESVGFPLPGPLAGEIERLDLRALDQKPAAQVLILETDRPGTGARLCGQLAALGAKSHCEHIPGPPIWVKKDGQDSRGVVPLPTLQCIASWMSEMLE